VSAVLETRDGDLDDSKEQDTVLFVDRTGAVMAAFGDDAVNGVEWERLHYDVEGVPSLIPTGDVDADGDADNTDKGTINLWWAFNIYDVRGDLDLDGDVDGVDYSGHAVVSAMSGKFSAHEDNRLPIVATHRDRLRTETYIARSGSYTRALRRAPHLAFPLAALAEANPYLREGSENFFNGAMARFSPPNGKGHPGTPQGTGAQERNCVGCEYATQNSGTTVVGSPPACLTWWHIESAPKNGTCQQLSGLCIPRTHCKKWMKIGWSCNCPGGCVSFEEHATMGVFTDEIPAGSSGTEDLHAEGSCDLGTAFFQRTSFAIVAKGGGGFVIRNDVSCHLCDYATSSPVSGGSQPTH
jgi:hypothetical protein